jgi:hypothetical protein
LHQADEQVAPEEETLNREKSPIFQVGTSGSVLKWKGENFGTKVNLKRVQYMEMYLPVA